MSRSVQFDSFGGPEILEVREVAEPHAGAGEVRVRVLAAGLNPVDFKIFAGGAMAERMKIALPSGNGNDFAGTVDEVGDGVEGVQLGDAVFGGARMHAQADYIIVTPSTLIPVPEGLSMDQAGSLDIVGRTAAAGVASLSLTSDDTVLISGAAGGVGVLAAQLAVRAGATVIGTAGADNQEFLRSLGVIPVEYGDGLVERMRAAAPGGITAVFDTAARGTIDAALALGVDSKRINTIADYAAIAEHGIANVGGGHAAPGALAEVAGLIAGGQLQFPIDSRYPLAEVRAAYEYLIAGHVRGKVVLVTE